MKPLAGQIALVTGAARGIGRGIAHCLADDGAAVIVLDKRGQEAAETVRQIEGRGVSGLAVQADVKHRPDLERALELSLERFGRVDILVNNAGVGGGPGWGAGQSPREEDWRVTFEVNLLGLVQCVEVFSPQMIERKSGRIINIASIAGKRGAPLIPFYSASKAAVIGLTKSLGKELANTKITVNAVTPAAVRTPMFEQMTEAHIQFMLSKIPMGRFGTVDEVTALVCWLASEECSFSTGAVFDVSGGRAVY